MTYSDHNQAYGRMKRQRADDRVSSEAELANQIQAQHPDCTRSDALHLAARILARGDHKKAATAYLASVDTKPSTDIIA